VIKISQENITIVTISYLIVIQETVGYTRTMIQACQDTLQDWFDAISCKDTTNVSNRLISH